jgi:hypothetical protein
MATSETEPAAIPRDRASQFGCKPTCVLDVPISGKPEIGAPLRDEVCGFKLYLRHPIGLRRVEAKRDKVDVQWLSG